MFYLITYMVIFKTFSNKTFKVIDTLPNTERKKNQMLREMAGHFIAAQQCLTNTKTFVKQTPCMGLCAKHKGSNE